LTSSDRSSHAGKNDKASQLYQYILKTWPGDKYAILAKDSLATGAHLNDELSVTEAVDSLLTDISLNKDIAKALSGIVDKYCKAGSYEKAAQLCQYVINNWRDDTGAVINGKVELAKVRIAEGNDVAVKVILDKLVAAYGGNPALPDAVFKIGEEYYNKAMADVNEGRTDQADANFVKTVSVWDRIITQFPESNSPPMQDAYYFAAYCYGQLGEYAKAIQYWQKIVDAWPDYRYAWHALSRMAYSYSMLGSSGVISESEARFSMEQAYKVVMENYPDCPAANDALMGLGNLNYGRGQWTEAAKYYELFLEKFPADKRWNDVLYSLAYAYQKMGQSQLAAELRRTFIEVAGSESGMPNGLKRWLENPQGAKK
jgi:tetratricopeptide (TPR) repeat protein